jgi:tetratricopeptide (TPR) repeat protein
MAAAGDCIAGRYQVEEVLGRGGMGAVYRVRDQRNGQDCALKRGWASDRRKAQRRGVLLEREYHTLTQLAHPRIIEVYEYGIDDNGPYYTMELLQGSDLDKGGQLPWKQACALLYDVASSLSILHARGLLHRDVSPRNVRCTPEGRAKLIDFGAMAAMGTAKDVVGTPPFVAPEVLQLQELDARADLFSLGALGYFLLTGRDAYPARRMTELRDVWRSKPIAPSRLVPELPQALSALIMQLLMLDRSARPKSAAEVMERLCALAGRPLEERVEVSRAYLTTPALVGRDQALLRARKQILSLVRRDGGTLLIEGAAGSGRSRMLDACVLEGKLMGITVLRADSGDAADGDWGVARALCAQLIELMPEEAMEAARLSKDVLGHVVEGVIGDGTVTAMQPERSLLLRELRDLVLSLSRNQRLLLAVDDVDKIDEPSAAFLAALAHKTERHAVMLALSIEREHGPSTSASLRLLRLVADTISLEPLQPEETLTLMRSIFGDVPSLQFVAGRIHALAQGSPRASMDLARHLAERDLARYEAGSWLLPSQLDDGDLPKTLADALAGRLCALGSDARALLDVQCLADGDALRLTDYPQLAGLGDHKRVFSALDELLAARVLMVDGENYRFVQRGFLPLVQADIPPERRRAIHARIAELLGRSGGDLLRQAHHLLRAGREREAIELLCSINLEERLPPVALLDQAIQQAERLAFPPRTLHQLRVALLSKASLVLAPESFRRHLPQVLAQLERDSGLALYRELSEVPQNERLQRAMADAHQRYLATPERERGHSVIDAIRDLATISGACCAFAAQLKDLEVLESLPSLEAFVPLSPAVAIVQQAVEACKQWLSGRYLHHRQICDQVLARISAPDRAGLDEARVRRMRAGFGYAIGQFEAALGISAAEARAKALEAEHEHRVNAWRLRMVLHINQGNVEEARKCERRAELLQLQESSEQSYVGMGAGFELMARAEAGDLVGVKNCVATLASFAEQYPGWRAMLAYGQCRYRWLQGDLTGALDVLLPAFEYAPPTRHNSFCNLAGAHVRLLAELGRTKEAVERGRHYLELHEREQLSAVDPGLWVGLSQALAEAGEHAQAVRTIETLIDSNRELGCAGLALGMLYETRARIASRMRDPVAFERFAELCATEYKKAHNPALSARFARLLEDARQHEIREVEPTPEIRELLQLSQAESEYDTVHSRILECIDDGDRGRCVLTLLLQSTRSNIGYLYGVRDGRAELLAALPEPPADDAVVDWVNKSLQAELGSAEIGTADADGDATRTEEAPLYTDPEERRLELVFLFATQQLTLQIVAVLVLHMPPGPRTLPSRQLCQQLANELLEHGDVSGLSVGEAATR